MKEVLIQDMSVKIKRAPASHENIHYARNLTVSLTTNESDLYPVAGDRRNLFVVFLSSPIGIDIN